MSTEPLTNHKGGSNHTTIKGNNTKGKDEKVPFEESINVIYCLLSVNSTTLYTYDNPSVSHGHKNHTNYVELVTQKLGEINEVQESRMDHLNIPQALSINGKNVQVVLYFKKYLAENGDLITIIILCGAKLLSSFVHNLLEKLGNEYLNEYYNVNGQYEFKLRMKEIICQEEAQLVTLVQNYGSVEDEMSQVREIMNENIDRILERGENLDTLINKTSTLNTRSNSFRRRTTNVKRQMMWSNIKFVVIVTVILIIVGYILLGLECGLPFYSKCIHPHKPNQPGA
jgi:vesicle-associated membrane protein 7